MAALTQQESHACQLLLSAGHCTGGNHKHIVSVQQSHWLAPGWQCASPALLVMLLACELERTQSRIHISQSRSRLTAEVTGEWDREGDYL